MDDVDPFRLCCEVILAPLLAWTGVGLGWLGSPMAELCIGWKAPVGVVVVLAGADEVCAAVLAVTWFGGFVGGVGFDMELPAPFLGAALEISVTPSGTW